MQQARPDSTGQVEEEIGNVPEKILDIIAEDPEEEHVPGEVQEAGVQKHAGKQRHKGDFKASVSRQERRETRRNRGVREEQGFISPARQRDLEAELVNEDGDVG